MVCTAAYMAVSSQRRRRPRSPRRFCKSCAMHSVGTLATTVTVVAAVEVTTQLPSQCRSREFYHYISDQVITPPLCTVSYGMYRNTNFRETKTQKRRLMTRNGRAKDSPRYPRPCHTSKSKTYIQYVHLSIIQGLHDLANALERPTHKTHATTTTNKISESRRGKQISQSGKATLTHYVQAIFCAHKQTMLMAMLNAIATMNILCKEIPEQEDSRVPWTGNFEGYNPSKRSLYIKSNAMNHCCLASLGQHLLPRHTLNMSIAAAAPAGAVPATMAIVAGVPTWELVVRAC